MEYFFLSEGRWKVWTCFDITCYLSCLGFDCVTCPLPAEALACTCSLFTLLVGCQSSHLRGGNPSFNNSEFEFEFQLENTRKNNSFEFCHKIVNGGTLVQFVGAPWTFRQLLLETWFMDVYMGRRFHTVRCDINIRFMMFHTWHIHILFYDNTCSIKIKSKRWVNEVSELTLSYSFILFAFPARSFGKGCRFITFHRLDWDVGMTLGSSSGWFEVLQDDLVRQRIPLYDGRLWEVWQVRQWLRGQGYSEHESRARTRWWLLAFKCADVTDVHSTGIQYTSHYSFMVNPVILL